MEATDRSDAPAPSAPEVEDAKAREEAGNATEDPKTFLVCVPGSAFGTSVFQAESAQDAANQFAAATGVTPVENEDGEDTVRVAVAELDTVQVNHDAVKEILNPKE